MNIYPFPPSPRAQENELDRACHALTEQYGHTMREIGEQCGLNQVEVKVILHVGLHRGKHTRTHILGGDTSINKDELSIAVRRLQQLRYLSEYTDENGNDYIQAEERAEEFCRLFSLYFNARLQEHLSLSPEKDIEPLADCLCGLREEMRRRFLPDASVNE